MRNETRLLSNIDRPMVLIYLTLVLLGWLNIYSAVYDESYSSIFDLSQRYGKQLLWIGLGFLIGILVLLVDAKFFVAFAFPVYGMIILLLVFVLLFGVTIAGSKSWFQVGGFALQPAEFAKFGVALALAAFLNRRYADISKLRDQIVAGLIIALPALLILAQNDTGSALVFVSFYFVLFREGMSGRLMILALILVILFLATLFAGHWIVFAGLLAVLLVTIFFIKRNLPNILSLIAALVVSVLFVLSTEYVYEKVLEPHQKNRIMVLLGKNVDLSGAGYNVNQSKIAIGSGSFFGKGYLNGTQTKYNFVPEQSTDFIFCTVGEEWGFVGSVVIIALYIGLFGRIIVVAERQRTPFARIYGYGVASVMFFHFAINVGMTIGLAPVIGIPLPYFSYGGSSLWAFTLMLFVFIRQDANRLNIL
jgi:rod shape determining protein RodA